MATHASAEKAARQALKHRARNQAMRSEYRTVIKKLRVQCGTVKNKGEAKETLYALLNQAQRVLMRAAVKDVIKFGTASRHISRLSSAVHKALS